MKKKSGRTLRKKKKTVKTNSGFPSGSNGDKKTPEPPGELVGREFSSEKSFVQNTNAEQGVNQIWTKCKITEGQGSFCGVTGRNIEKGG